MSAGTAQAATTHKFEYKLEGFGLPAALAVGPVGPEGSASEKSALYVVDDVPESADVVERFSAAGVPLAFSASEPYIEGSKLTGTPTGPGGAVVQLGGTEDGIERGSVAGVAVDDATGEIYVSTADVVDVFSSEGVYLSQLTGTCASPGTCPGEVVPFGGTSGLAVDQSTGDLYVSDNSSGVVDVFKLEPGGQTEYVSQFGSGVILAIGESTTVAVVESGLEAGKVYVGNGSVVDIFDSLGGFAPPEWTGASTPAGSFGGEGLVVGLDPSNDHVYVGEHHDDVVDELGPSATETYIERLTGTPTGPGGSSVPFSRPEAVAIDPSSGDLYVGDYSETRAEGVVDVFGPDLVVPDVETGEATDITASTATLNGKVSPLKAESGEPAECSFMWGTSESLGSEAKCEQVSLTAEESPVTAKLTKLQADTTYYYQLQVKNAKGTNEAGAILHFTTKGPGIEGESASDVTSTSVKLGASVNPDGVATSYFFQYGRTDEYEAQVPAAPAPLGSGSEPVAITPQLVQGLFPGSEYHYRTVAVSEVEVTPGHVELHQFDGPDQTFTTQTAGVTGEGGLPDGRQWQLVSPPDKHGALIEPIDAAGGTNGDVIQAAADGDAVTYVASAPTEPVPLGYTNAVQVFSARSPGGWSSHDLTIPHSGATDASVGTGLEYRFFSEDLSSAIIQPFGSFVPLSSEATEQTAYLQNQTAGTFTPLVTDAPGFANDGTDPFQPFGQLGSVGTPAEGKRCPPGLVCGPEFVGATADTKHVVLASNVALTETTIPQGPGQLYEYSGAEPPSKQLQLVSALPENEGGGVPVGGASFGGVGGHDARGAISSNGSRVFFTVTGDGEALYMRDVVSGKTVRLDVPEAACLSSGTCGKGKARTTFQFASSDGSRVLFTDTQRLTANSGAAADKPDLYECVIVESPGSLSCSLTDLTPRSATGESAGVGGQPYVLGVSKDGSYVSFVANGVLDNNGIAVPGAVHGTCGPPKNGGKQRHEETASQACNLYVRHEGTTSLVAVISGADYPDWTGQIDSLDTLTARVSPNGKWLAFMSDRSLTGYDNRDAVSGHPDEEVYLYHAPGNLAAESGSLICASCDPSGARPTGEEYGAEGENMRVVGGNEVWNEFQWLAADLPGWTPYELSTARYQSRYLSNSGRLYFNSHDALVPQAVNHNWDVYEWEPTGVPAGSGHECSTSTPGFTPSSGGCVGLISSGESPDESAFLDASETGGEGPHGEELNEGGGDVFFMTSAKLSPLDTDGNYDVYDAHECTSASPCLPTPAEQPPACTTTDSCRAASTPQPEVFGAPSSATFSGPGNLVPSCSSSSSGTSGSGSTCASKPPPGPSCSSSAGAPSTKCTKKQNLTKSLATCRRKYPHSKKKRQSCEAAARHKYGAKGSSHLARKK